MGLDCDNVTKSAEKKKQKKQKKNFPWEKETARGRYDKCRAPMNLSRESKGKGYNDKETGRGEVKKKNNKKKEISPLIS